MNTGYINRTVEHRGYTINCRDPYGFWDIENHGDQSFTTVSKAKDHIDIMILAADKAKAQAEVAKKQTQKAKSE